jgi:stage II sporulation protein D
MNGGIDLKKWIPLTLVLFFVMMMGVPSLLIVLFGKKEHAQPQTTGPSVTDDGPPIHLYLKEKKQIVTLPLEQYVKGVVAAEMPITFATEALKAQAVAARTNIVARLAKGLKTPEGADISDDSARFQAYSSEEQLRAHWGMVQYEINWKKISEAVAATNGEILTYQGEPIEAAFFSTSNGYTEASENYWGTKIPYLRSVSVPWDKTAPHATDEKTISVAEMDRLLGIQTVPVSTAPPLHVLEETAADRVKRIQVGDKTLTGREFREALGLYSTSFSWQIHDGEITFITHGYGHGVGMSQYGANGMAKEGRSYKEILTYFYQGVQIEDERKVLSMK